jgi:hypothetical protein
LAGALSGLSMLIVAPGCASVAPSFPVHGAPGQVERLSGDWRGEYTGDHDHVRHGTIAFSLMAGEEHAHGTVVMIPAGLDRPYQPYQGDELSEPERVARRHRVLAVQFVNAAGGAVTGVIAPYWDPDRRTRASATFQGLFVDDAIEGTFTTTYDSGIPPTGGRWIVRRVR